MVKESTVGTGLPPAPCLLAARALGVRSPAPIPLLPPLLPPLTESDVACMISPPVDGVG
jgi:hypothetical protein